MDLDVFRQVDVDQFFGIEIEEFRSWIAETAMYLVDHLENERLSLRFGVNVVDLPLRSTATICIDNALRIDWNDVLPAERCTYVFGNPPFLGQYLRSDAQTADLRWMGVDDDGYLDYVTGWYAKAMAYDQWGAIRFAFVSTNSISQGEAVHHLWAPLLGAGYKVDFAHRTFTWTSEARGKAHVHCVIVGFSNGGQATDKRLFDYPDPKGDPVESSATNINPYLADYRDIIVRSRESPLRPWVPTMSWGSKQLEGAPVDPAMG